MILSYVFPTPTKQAEMKKLTHYEISQNNATIEKIDTVKNFPYMLSSTVSAVVTMLVQSSEHQTAQ